MSRRTSENAISFFGAGGHKHDGVSSTLISTDKYSLFDFNPGYRGSQSRITIQQANQSALEEWVMNLVNTKVLAPAGLDLAPGLLSGKSIRANTITATELQANTITADEIAANAVTANELAANLVLVNNIIRSNNYDGTIAANGVITGQGTVGWAITHAGSAVFSSASIRGSIDAASVSTPGVDILANGAIVATNFNVTPTGNISATNANISGIITSGSGSIGGWTIDTNRIYGGSTYLYSNGSMSIGATNIASNGQITNGGYNLSAAGALTATGANITGTINADFGRIGGLDLSGSDLVAGELVGDNSYGQYVKLDAVGEIQVYRKDFNFGIGEYYVRVDIMGAEPGIKVLGTADGSYNETRIVSSFISTKDVILSGTSLITRLDGKANTHSHPYASDDHLHDSRYVNADGDTMTGILYGTGIDMTGNIRYGGQVYSDEAGGYAEFGAVGAPGTIGGRVFRINQASTLWSRSLATTGSRPVFVNDDSTLFCGATVSSLRYKNNVVNSVIDTKAFLELDVVDFYYNDEFYEDPLKKTMELGVIAEQVHEKGLIDLVRYDEIGRPDGLNDNKIPFYLLKACIDQQAEIHDLKARIQALEGV